ncbi:type II toxin-antitoxin system MqsR family toxin [Thioalkalivibrio nitratireducens]|uniref:type II toxin-antitoxin system MqsR family toxin n=1 Tax=Thioalkalivibrio nitratireducens TaxID=186931 RepID=UPI0005C25231|nr:type II toxin-antitoxin system MqsR family toxin [Thioalkalivibrio nitratireducens]
MVRNDRFASARRDAPSYALSRVIELANAGRIQYQSKTVQRDVENLGYRPEDVHRCLASLNECHFHRSEQYEASGPWFDVYHVRYAGPADAVDELYVKLKLGPNCLVVVLASFHRER